MKIELSHDILARKIYDKASAEDKLILKIERLIADDFERYDERGVLMGQDDYDYVAPYLSTVSITPAERRFIAKSYKVLERKKRNRNLLVMAIIGLLAVLGGLATVRSVQAEQRALDIRAKNVELRIQGEELKDRNKEIVAKNHEIQKSEQAAKIAEIKAKEAAQEARKAELVAKANAEKARKAEAQAKENAVKAREAEALAKANADSARINLKKAQDAEGRAIASAGLAKKRLGDALKAQQEAKNNLKAAIAAREEANKLRDIALSTKVANLAIRTIQSGDIQKGAELALQADSLNTSNNGPKQNPDTYAALNLAYQTILSDSLNNLNAKEVSSLHKVQDAAIRCIASVYSPSYKNITAYATEKEKLYVVNNNKTHDIRLKARPRSIAFSHNGRLLLVGTYSGDLLTFEITQNKGKDSKKAIKYVERKLINASHKGSIRYIEVIEPAPGRFFLAFASASRLFVGTLLKNQKDKKELIFNIKGNFKVDGIQTAAFSPDGKYLFAINKKTYQLFTLEYDLPTMDIITSPSIPVKIDNNTPTSAAIGINSLGEHLLAIGFKNGSIRISNVDDKLCIAKNYGCLFTQTEHKSSVTKLLFSNDASQLISSGLDQTAKIWNIDNFSEERIPLIGHRKWIWDIAYNKEEDRVFTVSEDRSIKIWDTDTEILSKRLRTEILRYRTRNPKSNTGMRKQLRKN